ncbi:MAG: 6-pyruvoyl tetrahydropterin synthase [bacterium]|nr:6-pyruvoyl tetrahydropterin synthase [bacterium]
MIRGREQSGARGGIVGFLLRIEKQYLKFSSAHFTLFPNSRERLHGHNYAVTLEVEAMKLKDGMVVDFAPLKRAAREACSGFDEKILLPSSERVQCEETDGRMRVTLDDGSAYEFPRDEVVVLTINNVTCEALAWLVSRSLVERRQEWDQEQRIARLRVWVAESPGQQGGYETRFD